MSSNTKIIYAISIIIFFAIIVGLAFVFDSTCSDLPNLTPDRQSPNLLLKSDSSKSRVEILKIIVKENGDLSDVEFLYNTIKAIEDSNATKSTDEIYFYELTDSLFISIKNESDFDSFFRVAIWSRQLKFIKITGSIDNQNFQNAIYNSWASFLINRLESFDFADLNECQKEKYQFLTKELSINGYILKKRQPNFEKFIFNLKHSNWSHLLTATFYKTTICQKIFIALVITITLLLYLNLLFKIITRIK